MYLLARVIAAAIQALESPRGSLPLIPLWDMILAAAPTSTTRVSARPPLAMTPERLCDVVFGGRCLPQAAICGLPQAAISSSFGGLSHAVRHSTRISMCTVEPDSFATQKMMVAVVVVVVVVVGLLVVVVVMVVVVMVIMVW